jgi:hypothetical protein
MDCFVATLLAMTVPVRQNRLSGDIQAALASFAKYFIGQYFIERRLVPRLHVSGFFPSP